VGWGGRKALGERGAVGPFFFRVVRVFAVVRVFGVFRVFAVFRVAIVVSSGASVREVRAW
jgi:hypothetical protein